MNDGGHWRNTSLTSDESLVDGKWHAVSIEWSRAGLYIALDRGEKVVELDPRSPQRIWKQGNYIVLESKVNKVVKKSVIHNFHLTEVDFKH